MAGIALRVSAAAVLAVSAAAALAGGKADKADLKKDLKDDAPVGDWNYDDIDGAFLRAAREKKPVCIVFR
jgi:hypothetical protein